MIFRTTRMQLAIYLIAAERLKLITCIQANPTGSIEFIFDDPKGKGCFDEFDFNRGAQVSAMALFVSHKYVRQMMTKAADKYAANLIKTNNTSTTADTQTTSAA
jgi:hypothetical protein